MTGPRLRTGDLLLVQGSRWIRVLTGESVSHVAVVLRRGATVWLTDYTLRGQRMLPALAWARHYRRRRVWHGVAPDVVRRHPEEVIRAADALAMDPPEYAWWELPVIWWHQLTGRPYRARGPQCHSYAYELWRAAGYTGPAPRDPGDFLALCLSVKPLEVRDE